MNGPSKDPFIGDKSVEDYVKSVMACVRNCQKLSSELAGWHHYRDYSGVERTMEQVNSLLTSLVSSIFKHQDIRIGLDRHKLIDQFDMIREGNDALLERINSDVDEASGIKKNADAELLEPAGVKTVEGPAPSRSGKNVILLASRNVQKPQLFFEKKINNSHKEPFIPLLKEKPNSKKPLAVLLSLDEAGNEYYSHPYEYELFHWSPMPLQLQPVTPKLPNAISETPIVMVETEEDLAKMVSELKECQEFGLDIEHHSYRSYQGLTCLLQISSRDIDYIVDPLALRGKLTILNEVFTDPKITKVAHGADHDIFWLQRDCGVYVVNLFDTHQAAVVLEYPHRSLAALLSRFCKIEANKVYQRADWRIRPLPEDFVNYARQDSHNLLYIYDLMRNELIQKGNRLNNLITAVYNRSAELCMRRYEKPVVGPESHMDIYRRSRKSYNSRQMFALQALYLWRDRVAREQDESTEYVLPKHMLLQIAEVLPKEMQGILACCNPIPPLVKTELLTIHTLIRESRQQQLIDIKPSNLESQLSLSTNQTSDDSSKLLDKHDLSQCEENPMNLPVLLKPEENLLGEMFVEHRISVVFRKISQMFGCLKNSLEHKMKSHYEISQQFISPYERYTNYLEMKPFLEGEKKKGGDQDRIKRIMDHFMTLTANTSVDEEAETDPRTRVLNQMQHDGPTQVPSIQEEVIMMARDKEQQDMAKSQERQITHQAIDSFLESARRSAETKSNTDHVSRLLSHYRDLAKGVSVESRGESPSSEEQTPAVVENPPKKKVKKKTKKLVLSDEVKVKVKKSKKTVKRQSSEKVDETPPKRMKTEEENGQESGKQADVDIKTEGENGQEMEEKEDGEICDSPTDVEAKETTGFDYDAADYSIFQKAKKKSFHNRPVKERFKGKKPKKLTGKPK